MEEWLETRQENAENRAWGLDEEKNIHLQKLIDLVNDVRKELNSEDPSYQNQYQDQTQEDFNNNLAAEDWLTQTVVDSYRDSQIDFRKNPENYNVNVIPDQPSVEKMETGDGWSRDKKDDKLTNMPFLGAYKKSIEGRRDNPPLVEKQYGTKRSPRPDPNGHRNPPNRRIPDPES